MRILHSAKTDVGLKRDNNEDNYLVFPEENLFAVFDGMGGHAAGEVASAIAATEVKEFFRLTGADEEATWPFKAERDRSYDENRLLTSVKLAEEEAKNFPQKNIILRALGQQKAVEIELRSIAPRPGDVFLLCSDGLPGMVADDDIRSILAGTPTLDSAVNKLV